MLAAGIQAVNGKAQMRDGGHLPHALDHSSGLVIDSPIKGRLKPFTGLFGCSDLGSPEYSAQSSSSSQSRRPSDSNTCKFFLV
jgi:hypothetical protein